MARVYFPNRYFHIDHNASCLQWLLKNLGGKQGAITGGHFACACVQPLYKEGVIAVIKMAREIQIVLFMFILVSFLIVSFTIQGNRAAEKCAVCGKTIVGEDGRPASGYKKDFLSCFGIDANTDGKVCGQCRKAVTDHRKSGQKFFFM